MTIHQKLDEWLLNSWGWHLFVKRNITHFFATRVSLGANPRILDLGGGAGAGTKALLAVFPSARIDLIEIDPTHIRNARQNLQDEMRSGQIEIKQMDATTLSYEDNLFDAVLCHEVLHHIPDWKNVLKNIYRIIKPGGKLLAAEALQDLLTLPVLRTLFPHPKEAHFEAKEFEETVYKAGFDTPGEFVTNGRWQVLGWAQKAL